MKEDWKECKLGELVEINQNSFSEKENWTFVNYLDTGSITENKMSEIQYINLIDEKLPSRAKRKVKKNSIVYSTVRPNQKHFGIIKLFPENFLVSTGFAVLDVNEKIANPDFIYYYLIQNENTESLHAIAEQTTSAYPAIKPSDIANLSINLPPLATQQKIATILSSLDDKIELNNKINDNLEQQAQAIFKSWFVDCMNSNTKMSDIIDVRDGTHDSPKPQESGYLLVTSKHLEPYSINPTDVNFIKKEDFEKINERSKVDTGDILLSMIGTVGIVSLVTDSHVNWAIKNMGLFKTSKEEKYKYFLLNYLKSKDIKNYIDQHLAGSTQKYISLSELRNLPINLPEPVILDKYNKLIQPIYEQIIENTKENQNLTTIRDTLLPKLMNGEIEVDEVKA